MISESFSQHRLLPGTTFPVVQFIPILAGDIDVIESWIADKKIHRWLDMGNGRQIITKMQLYSMLMSTKTYARLFGLPGESPVGLICINDIDNLMGTAEMWGLRGVYSSGPANIATAAALAALATGFLDYDREVMSTWVVDANHYSLRIHHKLGLKEVGRVRSRHVMDGKRHDRLLFDITREEFAALYPDVPSENGVTFRSMQPQFVERPCHAAALA